MFRKKKRRKCQVRLPSPFHRGPYAWAINIFFIINENEVNDMPSTPNYFKK
jgi:hypothetical protein